MTEGLERISGLSTASCEPPDICLIKMTKNEERLSNAICQIYVNKMAIKF